MGIAILVEMVGQLAALQDVDTMGIAVLVEMDTVGVPILMEMIGQGSLLQLR